MTTLEFLKQSQSSPNGFQAGWTDVQLSSFIIPAKHFDAFRSKGKKIDNPYIAVAAIAETLLGHDTKTVPYVSVSQNTDNEIVVIIEGNRNAEIFSNDIRKQYGLNISATLHQVSRDAFSTHKTNALTPRKKPLKMA